MLCSLSIVTDAFGSGDPMTPDAQILAPTAVPGREHRPAVLANPRDPAARAGKRSPGRLPAGAAEPVPRARVQRRNGHRGHILPGDRVVRAHPDAVPADRPGLRAAARRTHV